MKTNKTKPIKKIMIFTIITVMIVSLFVVPAFALPAVHVAWNQVDTSYTLEPVTITSFDNYVDWGSVSTDGMYAIVFDDLYADIIEDKPSSHVDLFPGFSGLGYLEIDEGDSQQYFIFGLGLQQNSDDITISIGYDSDFEAYCLFIDFRNGAHTAVTVGQTICTFYFTEYPPVEITGGSSATYFWNNHATYRVGVVSNGDTPTDPDDPDTPTPPADGEEQGIFAVWSKITQWIVQGLASVSNAFYADGKLTLLGTLCIIPLALGLAFLLIGIIQKFLRLRG